MLISNAIKVDENLHDTMIILKAPVRDKEWMSEIRTSSYLSRAGQPSLKVLLLENNYSMAEPLARIGRGGAGNYWSKADLEEVEKAGTRNEVRSGPLVLPIISDLWPNVT